MTIQIPKSILDDVAGFAAAVEAHITALVAHRNEGNAAPTAHPLVERAVRRVQYPADAGKPDDFVADFEVIDDSPPAPADPTPDQRRASLVAAIRKAEAESIALVMRPGKLRLLVLQARTASMKAEADRTDTDRATLVQRADVIAKIEAISLRAATLEAELDDLTDEQLVTWSMKLSLAA